MGRSRYVITEPDKPHFLTYTVVEWLPVFTRPEAVAIPRGAGVRGGRGPVLALLHEEKRNP